MKGRAVAAWSGACLVITLATSNPAYRVLVLAVVAVVLIAACGASRLRRLFALCATAGLLGAAFNLLVYHVGATVLFELPDWVPVLGGPYTLEALVFGLSAAVTIGAAILAVAPVALLLEPHDVLDALPRAFSRTGAAIAASLNLVPAISGSFVAVADAQRLRGWRPRGPRSWAEVVVPVVLTAIEDSIQLAEAMEARGFGSGPRTHLRPARMTAADWLVVATSGLAVAAYAVARITGGVAEWYPYPALHPPEVAPLPVVAILLLLLPARIWRSRPSRV